MKDACAIVRTAAKVADGVSGAIFFFFFFPGELGRKREERVRRCFKFMIVTMLSSSNKGLRIMRNLRPFDIFEIRN